MNDWIDPQGAMDMVFDDPAGTGSASDFGFAVLWSRNTSKGTRHLCTDLVGAKLQPRRPSAAEQLAAGTEWPITAWDHRLILADGVPDPDSLKAQFHTYDRQTEEGVALLGALQTLRFNPDMPRWQMMHRAYLYVSTVLQPRQLSSILVQHMPSDARSAARPHVHIFTLSLEHRTSGFGRIHPDFRDHPGDMQLKFEAEWNAFRTARGWAAG